MNRRGFINSILRAGAAAAILPAATTYARNWSRPAGCDIYIDIELGLLWILDHAGVWRPTAQYTGLFQSIYAVSPQTQRKMWVHV